MSTRSKVAKAIIRDRRSVRELIHLLRREVKSRQDVERKLRQQEERYARIFGYRVECSYGPEPGLLRAYITIDARAIKGIADKRALIYDVAAQLVRDILTPPQS